MPAVLLGDRQAEDAHALHPLDERLRVGVGVLQLPDDGPDLAVDEVANRVDDVLFVAAEVGHAPSFDRADGGVNGRDSHQG